MTRVIGLISGTSVDGIDAALVDISGTTDLQVEFIAGETYPYPPVLRQQILRVAQGAPLSMSDLATLDDTIAQAFAQAAIAIQSGAIQSGQPAAELIGSHGQTVYHRPPQKKSEFDPSLAPPQSGSKLHPSSHPAGSRSASTSLGYSFQLGRGATIAQLTRITTVSNFRAADIAAGGEGAPLVPAVDAGLLTHPTLDRCVQNIGGIGNVAYLPSARRDALIPNRRVIGWDTGPGNSLLDLAVHQLSAGAQTYDHNGDWAASGQPCSLLVEQWLQQDFFQQPPPKSTGRELFGQDYFEQCCRDASAYDLSPADLLATLTELTAASIAHSYRSFLPQMPNQVLLCGGGCRNLYLRRRLQAQLEAEVLTTDDAGLDADFKEAIAFAVLGYWHCQGIPSNLPEVTGAKKAVILGETHPAI